MALSNVYRFVRNLGEEGPRESYVVSGTAPTIYQGDMIQWDPASRYVTNNLLGSGSIFVGVAEEASPVAGIGSTTNPLTGSKIRVRQSGLHRFKTTVGDTYSHRDVVYQGADQQTVAKAGSTRSIGLVWLPDGSQVTGASGTEVTVMILTVADRTSGTTP